MISLSLSNINNVDAHLNEYLQSQDFIKLCSVAKKILENPNDEKASQLRAKAVPYRIRKSYPELFFLAT